MPHSPESAATRTSAREALKGQPREAVESAVRRAVGDAVFLFVLVIQPNEAALETARLEGLRAAAVTFWMGALLGGPRSDDPTRVVELADAWRHWRATLDAPTTKVRVEGEARLAPSRKAVRVPQKGAHLTTLSVNRLGRDQPQTLRFGSAITHTADDDASPASRRQPT